MAQRQLYGMSSASHPTAERRTLSTTRSPNGITRNTVAQLERTINARPMNISSHSLLQPRSTIRTGTLNSTTRSSRVPNTGEQQQLPNSYSVSSSNIINTNQTSDRYEHYRSSRPVATVYSINNYSLPGSNLVKDSATSKLPKSDRYDEPISTSNARHELAKGGLTGLQNLGNTCFMNSVLQCLSNTKPLLLFCLQDNLLNELNTSSTSVMKGALMREYANLIKKMWLNSGTLSAVSPSSFKNTIGRFAPRFTGYAEQDSQEFLRYLLQGLHEDVNRVQQKPKPIIVDDIKEEQMKEKDRAKASWDRCLRYDNSRLVEIFAGQLKSTLECSYCQYQSITFDMFWDLSIPLPRNKSLTTVQECLQLFMSKEELNGDEKPMCAKCKQKRPCTKQFSIQKCPEILVLHLKRFSQTRGRSKLNTFVDFPLKNLKLSDLNDVMSESYEGSVPTYNLFGISNHSGTLYSGHYTAQCKHPFTHQWYEFNDSSVYPLNEDLRIASDNAYMLFYEQNKN